MNPNPNLSASVTLGLIEEEEATVGVCAKYLSLPLLMEAEGW